jgi:hypothetical protein
MKRILIAAAATAALAMPALAQNSGGMSTNGTSDNMSPMVDVSKAKIEGSKITGVTAQIDKPGYLVIHNKGAGAPPASLGHIALDPGTTRAVNIESDSTLDPSSDITLMLHYETNDNNSYDFGPGSTDVDTPVMVGDKAINVPVKGAM